MVVPTRREILEPMATDKEGAELKDLVLARLMVLLEEGDWKGLPVDIRKSLKTSIRVFVTQYVNRYRAAGSIAAFLKNEEAWLDSPVWLHTAARFYFRSEDFNMSESEESEPSVAGDLADEEDESTEEDPITSKAIDSEVKVMDLQGDVNMYIEETKISDDNTSTSNRGRKRKPKVKDQSVSEFLALSKRNKSIYKEDSDSDNWEEMFYEPPPKKTRGSWRGRGRGRGRGGRGRGKRARSNNVDQGFGPDSTRNLVEDYMAQTTRTDLDSYTSEELLFAATQSAIRDNRPEVRQAIKLATRIAKNPVKAKDLLKGSEDIIPYTEVEAVLLTVENNLPNRVYQELRLSSKSRYADIYPTYHHVGNAKISCYPEGIQVNNNVTEVPLQSLLNHTAERILQLNKDELTSINPIGVDRHKLILSVKWGFDGSSGSAEYRESDLFCTSLVPMYLKSGNDFIWKNPNPASIRFCRPLSLQLGKESPEMAYEAQIRVETQIRDLKPYSTSLKAGAMKKKPLHWRQKKKKEEEAKRNPEKAAREEAEEKKSEEEERNRVLCSADIFFHVQQTILDPSILNSITGSTASVDCHICSSKPNPFDQASLNAAALRPNIPINPEAHKYTFSSMHAWVSVFECLIHLSCFLPQETWSAGTDVNMRVSQRKAEIQRSFRKELNFNIDRPRTGLSVNAGDAYIAKKAFESEGDFARICGLDQGLIHRFHVILNTLSCEYEIDTEEFGLYCQTTCELFNAQYHWFHIPLIVHKLLHHGQSIISESILPIGMMSEEAHRARNKGYKPFFARHAKKEGKEHVMTDAMKFLMVTSDPLMSTNSINARKTRQNWSTLGEVISLLKDSKGVEVKQEILDALEEEPLDDQPDVTDQQLLSHREALDLSFDTADPHPVVIQTDDPHFTIHNPQIATVYHNSALLADSRTVIADHRTIMTDPRTIMTDPRTIMTDPRTVVTDPRAIVSDPRYHHNPVEVTYDPNLTHIAFSIVPNISL